MKILGIFTYLFIASQHVRAATPYLRASSSSARDEEIEANVASPSTCEVGFCGATTFLKHVAFSGEWDGDADDIFSKALLDSYNEVHQGTGYSVESSYFEDKIVIPEGDHEGHKKKGHYESIDRSFIKCKLIALTVPPF